MARSLLRVFAVVIAFAALVFAVARPAAAAVRGGASARTSLALQVVAAINTVRVQHGLRPVVLSGALSAAAAQHTREMAQDGYFAHVSHDGSAFWQRIERSYPPLPGKTWSVGENLLWSADTLDAAAALRLWMASPEHRANILTGRWREIGIAAVRAAAPGVFGGQTVTIVTTDFGVRR